MNKSIHLSGLKYLKIIDVLFMFKFIGKISDTIEYFNNNSGSLTSDSSGELHVLWHDGNSLGVDGAKVGVLEEADQVGFRGLLERDDRRRLEAKVGLEVLRDLADEALEGELADQELGRLLVTSGDATGPV